jgi:hypothetical protein
LKLYQSLHNKSAAVDVMIADVLKSEFILLMKKQALHIALSLPTASPSWFAVSFFFFYFFYFYATGTGLIM